MKHSGIISESCMRLMTFMLVICSSLTLTGQDLFEASVTIPEPLRIGPERLRQLPVVERQFMLSELETGDRQEIFQAPPCMEGNFYVAIQLYYDLGDEKATTDWSSVIEFSFLHEGMEQWHSSLAVSMKDQQLLSTAFHHSAISCSKQYEIQLNRKVSDASIPEDNIYVRILLFRDQTDAFDPSATLMLDVKPSAIENQVVWNFTGAAAVGYDVEWVFIDAFTEFSGTAQQAFQQFAPVSVSTPASYFNHNVLYPSGRLFYRVRAVGNGSNQNRITGDWVYSNEVAVQQAQPDMSYKAQTRFNGNGSFETEIQYVDGDHRERQRIVAASDRSISIASEKFYDYEGRLAVEVIPAPLSAKTLLYQKNLNQFSAVEPLVKSTASDARDKYHYDNGAAGNSILSDVSGSSHYFSPRNEHGDAFIPDGEGYVYKQTIYGNDATTESITTYPGKELRADGDHVTRVYQGTATREEVVRLLGSDGLNQRLSKKLVVDVNGNVVVQYVDSDNKSVIEADVHDNVAANPVQVNLLQGVSSGPRSSFVLLNAKPGTAYSFNYSAASDQIVDFEMSIQSPDGSFVDLSFLPRNESHDQGVYRRHRVKASVLNDIAFDLKLESVGNYTVSRRIDPVAFSVSEMIEQAKSTHDVAELLAGVYAQTHSDSLACGSCLNLTEDQKRSLREKIAEQSVVAELENLRNFIIYDLHDDHNDTDEYAHAEENISDHPLYGAYAFKRKNISSYVFDRSLDQVNSWKLAIKDGLDNTLVHDPFFNADTLSGFGYEQAMKDKLDNITLASFVSLDDTIVYRGNIAEVTDPDNSAFYVDINGQPDARGGIHPLYVDLLSLRNRMTKEAFENAMDEKRWNLYRNYYLQAKREIMRTIPEYSGIPQEDLNGKDTTSMETDVYARNTVAIMEWSFNKRFSAEDKQAIVRNLSAYFESSNDNFLHVILESDLASNELAAVQSVLNKYGCNLDYIAQEDKLTCAPDDLADPYLLQPASVAAHEQQTKLKESASARISSLPDVAEERGVSVQKEVSASDINNDVQPAWSGKSVKSIAPPREEFDALVSLFQNLGGQEWKNKTGWKDGVRGRPVSVAGWYGVITNEKGRVVALKLQDNNLHGVLPESIGAFTELRYLDLGSMSPDGNKITGQLPVSIGNLTKLSYLDLENNKIEGTFPAQLYRLQNLRSLNLNGNNFSGSLSGDIGRLTSLKHLALSGNQLSGPIPAEIGKLLSLKQLDLSRNKFTHSIPASTGNLSQLTRIDLSYNALAGNIPSTWSSLKSIQYVRLNNNQLQRNIPVAIASWKNAVQIDLSFNKLSGDIPSLGDLPGLQHLVLSNNQLTGGIPRNIPSLPNLKSLNLANNRLEGTIPSSVFESPSLEYLNLSGNMLRGEIPPSIGNASKLERVLLSENELSGAIPASIGSNGVLKEFEVHHNKLTGALPEEISSMRSLRVLHAGHNRLEGKIPASIGSIENLETLILSSNQFADSIPSALAGASRLQRLDLSENNLTGPIPEALGNLTQLQELTLNNNKLSGHLPASLSRVPRVIVANNRLGGTIPSFATGNGTAKGDAVWLSYNKFTFADILPLKDQLDVESFLYHRQDSVDARKTVPLFIDQPFELTTQIDRNVSPACEFQWFRYVDGVRDEPLNEASASGHTLQLNTVTAFDNGGRYYYKVTNPAIPGLTLTSHIQTVMALPGNTLCTSYAPLNTFIVTEPNEEHIQRWKQRLSLERETLVRHEIKRSVYQYLKDKLSSESIQETFTVAFTPPEVNHRVNHYDIAGNLTRSVPRGSAQILNLATINSILRGERIAANDNAGKNFQYNSFNRLTVEEEQGTLARYAYNRDGNLRLTQEGSSRDKFAYYRYDDQGREIERGTLRSRLSFDELAVKLDDPAFLDKSRENLSDITVTQYDYDSDTQIIARGRTVKKEYWATADTKTSVAASAYDANGYLSKYVQHDTGLDDKVTAYRHDPLSGKLLFQFYQYGAPDEFSQRYSYDASGNLTQIQSSADGYIWNSEATYTYYDHGPLRELMLGEYNATSMRYSYTIQGWLKGVNDQGALVKKDSDKAYAYTLGYFRNDFKPIRGNYDEGSSPSVSYDGTASWTSREVKEDSAESRDKNLPAVPDRIVYDPSGKLLAAYTQGEMPVHSIYGTSMVGIHKGSDQVGVRKLGDRNFTLADDRHEPLVVVSDEVSVKGKTIKPKVLKIGEAARESEASYYDNLVKEGNAASPAKAKEDSKTEKR